MLARVGESLPWEVRSCGPGSKGEWLYSWAAIGDAEGGTLLMRRRTPDKRHEKIDFFYCKPPVGQICAPVTLLRIAGRRWPIEEVHRDAKQLACMDAYQVRCWTPLHRHLALAMAAMLVYTLAEAHEATRSGWNRAGHLTKRPDRARRRTCCRSRPAAMRSAPAWPCSSPTGPMTRTLTKHIGHTGDGYTRFEPAGITTGPAFALYSPHDSPRNLDPPK